MMKVEDYINEELSKDEELRKEYEALQPEFEIIKCIIEARSKQDMTQEELAQRSGIDRANISRIENGNANPSLRTLRKLAKGLGVPITITINP